jgi:uncharacterized protein
MRRFSFTLIWLWCLSALAAEVIPPSPAHYFNDYAHVVDAGTAQQLEAKLDNFERATGNQVVVAVYPKMQSDSSIDDYANTVFRAWKIGQKDKNNGVLLLVYTGDRKMFIEVGYGLEGALPDATCKQITEYEIKPHFKTGDYAGGLTAGVNAILAATQHEYKGNGTTVANPNPGGAHSSGGVRPGVFFFIILIFIIVSAFSRRSRSNGWIIGGGGLGGFSGGGWGGGGGGGFSGGGGSSGGGGAGSSW